MIAKAWRAIGREGEKGSEEGRQRKARERVGAAQLFVFCQWKVCMILQSLTPKQYHLSTTVVHGYLNDYFSDIDGRRIYIYHSQRLGTLQTLRGAPEHG